MQDNASVQLSFPDRIGMAFRLVFSGSFARQIAAALRGAEKSPASPPPERVHGSALAMLSALQREGRLIDFLQQDVAGFSDADVGAAARVVHAGTRKVLQQYVSLEPVLRDEEGADVVVPDGFDAQRIRLTGNVAGQPPFKGTLKHHGWVAKETRFPSLQESLDTRILAPAEVELTG